MGNWGNDIGELGKRYWRIGDWASGYLGSLGGMGVKKEFEKGL